MPPHYPSAPPDFQGQRATVDFIRKPFSPKGCYIYNKIQAVNCKAVCKFEENNEFRKYSHMRQILRFLVLCLIIPLGGTQLLWAQSFRVHPLSMQQMLPSEHISSLMKDEQGIMWVGTPAGLAFYDGQNFQEVEHSLARRKVLAMLRGEDAYYVINDRGFSRFYPGLDTVQVELLVKHNEQIAPDTLPFSPQSLYQSEDGSIWIVEPYHLSRWTQYGLVSYLMPSFTKPYDLGLPNFVLAESQGHLVAFSRTGYGFYFDPTQDRFLPLADTAILPRTQALVPLSGDRLLAVTDGGIFEIQFSANNPIHNTIRFIHPMSGETAILGPQQQRLWIGTQSEGIFYFPIHAGELGDPVSIPGTSENKALNMVFDAKGNLWAGTYFGLQVIEKLDFQHLFPDLSQNFIHEIGENEQGTIHYVEANRIVRVQQKASETYQAEVLYTAPEGPDYLVPLTFHHQEVWSFNTLGEWIRVLPDGRTVSQSFG